MSKVILYIIFAVSFCNVPAITAQNLSRITNGVPAAESQFPYAISLQQLSAQTTETRGHRCGGALITLQHALTAASCLYDTVNDVTLQISPNNYRVFAGAVLLTNDVSTDRVRSIANFTVHPEYIGPPARVNDIAIITFSSPFLTTTVTPISLPLATSFPADFTLCTVAGWGSQNMTANATTQLRYVNKYIYNQDICTRIYNTAQTRPNILTTMICAASYDIISSGCLGDEGNALVCQGNLTGILSFTDGCASSSFPEMYTRVANYTSWIRSITGSANNYKPGFFLLVMFTLVQVIFI